MRRRRPILGLTVLALAGGACGGGSAVDGELVGDWKHYDVNGAGVLDELTFASDGSFELDGPTEVTDDALSGTYTLSGNTLHASGTDTRNGSTGTIDVTIYVSHAGDELVVGTLLPAGNHAGIVGTWSGTNESSDTADGQTQKLGGTQTLVFNADHTGILSQDFSYSGTAPTTYGGTWSQVGDDFTLTVTIDALNFATVHGTLIDGAAFGGEVYTK